MKFLLSIFFTFLCTLLFQTQPKCAPQREILINFPSVLLASVSTGLIPHCQKAIPLVGKYQTAELEKTTCLISTIITQVKGKYHYELLTSVKSFYGTLEVTKTQGGLSLKFNGLYYGNPDSPGIFKQTNSTGRNRAQILRGTFLDGKIVFQNYGNSLNDFIIFPECENKYIELVKS